MDVNNELIKASTLAWIIEKKIKNEKGKVIELGEGSNHFFLYDLYADRSQEIVVKKPSQAGVSTWAILSGMHDGRYWGINQIHTLPTGADVAKFVPSKVNEIIKHNPTIRRGMSDKEVDAVGQKQFGKGFIYYKGTHSERESLMLTSDRNTYDELDKSDQAAIGFYRSRQEGAESLKQQRWISTPTMPGYGIDLVFEASDQKHWRFNCPHCKHRQHMVWPDNVDMERGVYVCSKCGGPLGKGAIRKGAWEPKYPGRPRSGYQLTQMIQPWVTAQDMVDAFKDAEAGKNGATLEYFFNHKLGQAFISSSGQIPESIIKQNLIQRDHLEINSCMGVDVQLHELYAIVGSPEGVYGILRIQDDPEYISTNGKRGRGKWDKWGDIMNAFDVRYCVIDGGFTPNEVIEAAKKFPGRVWVNWYKADPTKEDIVRFSEVSFKAKAPGEVEEIRVLTDRDRMLDDTVAQLRNGNMRFFFHPNSPAIEMLIEHCRTTYAREVTDRAGIKRREWYSSGKDDLLHALVYFRIALLRRQITEGDIHTA